MKWGLLLLPQGAPGEGLWSWSSGAVKGETLRMSDICCKDNKINKGNDGIAYHSLKPQKGT